MVSHDLRNSLNVAYARLELIQVVYDSEHLDRIGSALDRMDELIEELLGLAHFGQDHMEIRPVEIDVAVRKSWATVETANATLTIDTDRVIRCDPRPLRQLFENLFRNAVELGGEAVTVQVTELGTGFAIADDDPGIPESKRSQVFRAGFSTLDDGTGLGLRLAKEIVAAHDWDIHLTDARDGGTKFEIRNVDFVD